MHDVLASLREAIESHEEGVGGDLPLVLGLLLVLVVGILELGADVEGKGELVVGDLWLISTDKPKDGWSINGGTAPVDDGVADLSNQHHKSSWSVVVLGVGPDQENSVHDWDEEIDHVAELLGRVGQLVEQVEKGLKVEEVLGGFRPGDLNLLLELGEWTSVGGLVLFQELEDLLDSLGTELLADSDKIKALIFPEVDLSNGVWVVTILECSLWVFLEHLLDLLGPVDDGTFEQLGFVLA